jgi:hypothetical protein
LALLKVGSRAEKRPLRAFGYSALCPGVRLCGKGLHEHESALSLLP